MRKKKNDCRVAVRCAHGEIWPIEKLKPNPRNPNTHPDEQLRLLAKIITTQGWRSPIVVSKRSGLVVKGHGRLAAAKLANLTEAPVDLQDYADEATETADMVADNRLSELAEMSLPDLKKLLEELGTSKLDMELTGFNEMELDRLMTSLHVDGENSVGDVWVGMPACNADNQLGIAITVRFQTVAEKVAFGEILKQEIKEDTKAVWYPYRARGTMDQLGTKDGARYG